MALDHYVSQVHLRQFYSPSLGNAFYIIKKNDLKKFHQSSAAVCRIEENSTNKHLENERAIEEFLKEVEPNYPSSIEEISKGIIGQKSIYTIAGFIAYVNTCSPAAMRMQSAPLKATIEESSKMMEKMDDFPNAPESLGGKSLSELIDDGTIGVKIDPKYPQAIGIAQILLIVQALGNSYWEILHNEIDGSPFFTSDFPICAEETADLRITNKIVPLSPNIAVRIVPNIDFKRDDGEFKFEHFRWSKKKLTRNQVMHINRLIVRCAETMVIFKEDEPWVEAFVKKNAKFRLETNITKIPAGNGSLILARQEISKL